MAALLKVAKKDGAPKFDGSGALKFVKDYEKYAVLQDWDDTKMVQNLESHCTSGLTRAVRAACSTENHNGEVELAEWDEVKAWITDEYGKYENVDDILAKALDSMEALSHICVLKRVSSRTWPAWAS